MFNFTGSEKAAAALTPIFAPLTIIITAGLAWAGLGEFPSPEVLAQAFAFTGLTILGARLVWQVPNTGFVQMKEVEDAVTEVIEAVANRIEENPA